MKTIKLILNADIPLWLCLVVAMFSVMTTSIIERQDQQVDPIKVTTITLTGEGGESIFSFRIQESDSEDQEVGQD